MTSVKRALLIAAVLVAGMLSGCIDLWYDDGGDVPPRRDTSCEYASACPADPSDPDYQYMLATYGLRQVNMEPYHTFRASVGGDLVAWQAQADRDVDGGTSLVALNTSSNVLYEVSVEDGSQGGMRVDDGRIYYTRRPGASAADASLGQHVRLWVEGEGDTLAIGPSHGGALISSDMEGDWILYREHSSEVRSDVWVTAHNIKTNESVAVWKPDPEWWATLSRLTADKAYVQLTPTDSASPVRDRIWEVDLVTGLNRTVLDAFDFTVPRGDAGGGYLALSALYTDGSGRNSVIIFDSRNNETWTASPPGIEPAWLSVAGEWVVWHPADSREVCIEGVHLPTREYVVLQWENEDILCSSLIDTDGERYVIESARNSLELAPGDDTPVNLYVGTLPDMA